MCEQSLNEILSLTTIEANNEIVISLENTVVKCQTIWESPKMPWFPFLKVTFSVSFCFTRSRLTVVPPLVPEGNKSGNDAQNKDVVTGSGGYRLPKA